jgi:ankyrin repeat protein/Mg2+ and Co2+ transporter CorA
MGRSPSRSSDGGSENRERPEVRLLKAIEEHNHDAAVTVIETARAKSQPIEHLLRIGLMRAAERDNKVTIEYLLENGAHPDGSAGGRVSPLLKAIEKNNFDLVRLLLRYGGNVDVCDKKGRTALMTAAWRNRYHIMKELLRCGADFNRKDHKGRNVLHNLAADKHNNWGRDVISELLARNIAIDGAEGQDELKRSPLHWAAVTGKKELCEMLLRRPRFARAQVNAKEIREKTSLHLAVSHGRDDIVELLLHYGADVKARSDGSWTPLHNACEKDNTKIVRQLLEAGADVNAKLLNGMTPLHLAAQSGQLQTVMTLLERKDLKRAARDTFNITPFLRAAMNKRKDIVSLLAPFNNVEGLSDDALGACKGFMATIVDFGNFHNENKVTKRTVFELLYGRDNVNPRKAAVNINPTDSKATSFRWIHLPANNMAWVEALLTKSFIEEGASDVEGFKALERSFSHQHRGQQVHSHFMRPLCQSTPRAPKNSEEPDLSDGTFEKGPPQITINGGSTMAGAQENPPLPKTPVRTDTITTDQTDWTLGSTASGSGKEKKDQAKGKEKTKKLAKWSNTKQSKPSSSDTPTKHSDHPSRRKANQSLSDSAYLRSPGSSARKDPTQVAKGNIFTFMPYLHFESTRRRQKMQEAIEEVQALKRKGKHEGRKIRHTPHPRPYTSEDDDPPYDEMLIRAHLGSSTMSLHVRRTLDQFYYHNIDTYSRDQDQVVYRYQMKDHTKSQFFNDDVDPKIFMVDQLWMWVLGSKLIVTSFPQRWQQPKNDPLNVLDGIIEDINSKTREPVRSVYDLALIITGRCSGVFDRHRMDEDYQFLDMFESSIGDATEEETKLFREFNIASAQASQWLQHHRRPNRFSRQLEAEGRVIEYQKKHTPHPHGLFLAEEPMQEDHSRYDDDGPEREPLFVDKLLDIGAETDLLKETKDIRDELNMITKVLEDQRAVLPDLELSITDIYHEEHKGQRELKRRFREQLKTIDVHLKDIERMDKQAERIYKSITDLLDLKQKHANAFEARFARDQAAGTARQSQTVMVFTIVTIVFLPLSFIAAFFTINIREFPRQPGASEPSLPLAYVSKYMFGIGFAISIPLVAIALSLDAIDDFFREVKRRYSNLGQRKTLSPTAHTNQELDTVIADTTTLTNVFSTGRSTARGRRSYESGYMGGSLLPVTSRDTTRSGYTGLHANGNGVGHEKVGVPVARQSTGFRIRKSAEVERGV